MFALHRLSQPLFTAFSSLRGVAAPDVGIDEQDGQDGADSSSSLAQTSELRKQAPREPFEPDFGDDADAEADRLSLTNLDLNDPPRGDQTALARRPSPLTPQASQTTSRAGFTPRPFARSASFAYVEIPVRHDTSRSSRFLYRHGSPSKSTPAKATLTTSVPMITTHDSDMWAEDPQEVLSAYSPSSVDSADEYTSPVKSRRGIKKPACCPGCTAMDNTASGSRHTHNATGGKRRPSPTKRKSVGGEEHVPKRGRPSLQQSNTDTSPAPKKGKGGKAPVKRRTSAPAALLLQEASAGDFDEFGSVPGKLTLASRMKPKTSRTSTAPQLPKPPRKGRKPDVWVRGAADDSASDSDEEARQPESFDAFWARVQQELPQSQPVVQGEVAPPRRPKTYAEVEMEASASSSSRWESSPASMDERASAQSTPVSTDDPALTPAIDVNSFAMNYPPFNFDLPPDSIRELAIAALAASKPPDEPFSHPSYDSTNACFDPALVSNEALVMPFKYQQSWRANDPAVQDQARHEHLENVAEALAAFINIEGE